jgi:hypothetical protein
VTGNNIFDGGASAIAEVLKKNTAVTQIKLGALLVAER